MPSTEERNSLIPSDAAKFLRLVDIVIANEGVVGRALRLLELDDSYYYEHLRKGKCSAQKAHQIMQQYKLWKARRAQTV